MGFCPDTPLDMMKRLITCIANTNNKMVMLSRSPPEVWVHFSLLCSYLMSVPATGYPQKDNCYGYFSSC